MAALGRVLADASGSAGFALAGEGPTARVDLIAPELTSASGAHFTGGADSRIGYLYGADEPAVIATGRWSIGGGDLPSGTLSIARHEDGRVTGVARFEPYSAQGARLAPKVGTAPCREKMCEAGWCSVVPAKLKKKTKNKL